MSIDPNALLTEIEEKFPGAKAAAELLVQKCLTADMTKVQQLFAAGDEVGAAREFGLEPEQILELMAVLAPAGKEVMASLELE